MVINFSVVFLEPRLHCVILRDDDDDDDDNDDK